MKIASTPNSSLRLFKLSSVDLSLEMSWSLTKTIFQSNKQKLSDRQYEDPG